MFETVCFIIMFSQKKWNHLNGDYEKKSNRSTWSGELPSL